MICDFGFRILPNRNQFYFFVPNISFSWHHLLRRTLVLLDILFSKKRNTKNTKKARSTRKHLCTHCVKLSATCVQSPKSQIRHPKSFQQPSSVNGNNTSSCKLQCCCQSIHCISNILRRSETIKWCRIQLLL